MGASSFLGPSTWDGRPCLLRNSKGPLLRSTFYFKCAMSQCVSGLDVAKSDNGSRPIELFVLFCLILSCLFMDVSLPLRHAEWNAPVRRCYKQQWALLRVPAVGSAVWTSSGGPRLGTAPKSEFHRRMWHHM